jgi:hypothetical protein
MLLHPRLVLVIASTVYAQFEWPNYPYYTPQLPRWATTNETKSPQQAVTEQSWDLLYPLVPPDHGYTSPNTTTFLTNAGKDSVYLPWLATVAMWAVARDGADGNYNDTKAKIAYTKLGQDLMNLLLNNPQELDKRMCTKERYKAREAVLQDIAKKPAQALADFREAVAARFNLLTVELQSGLWMMMFDAGEYNVLSQARAEIRRWTGIFKTQDCSGLIDLLQPAKPIPPPKVDEIFARARKDLHTVATEALHYFFGFPRAYYMYRTIDGLEQFRNGSIKVNPQITNMVYKVLFDVPIANATYNHTSLSLDEMTGPKVAAKVDEIRNDPIPFFHKAVSHILGLPVAIAQVMDEWRNSGTPDNDPHMLRL